MRLIDWNIQWGRGSDGRVDLVRIAETLRSFDPDLICLQELAVHHPGLPGGAGMDQVAMLGGLFLGYQSVFGAATDLPDGLGGRRLFGNMIISRYPVQQVFRHALPFPADPAVPAMARAALEAVVAAPWGPLRLITTHLEYYSQRQRAAQLAALREIHAEGWRQAMAPPAATDTDPPFAVLPRGTGTVICGDFNCAPEAAEMALLTRPFVSADGIGAVPPAPTLHDAWVHLHGIMRHAPTAGRVVSAYFPAPTCFDRAYLGDNLLARLRAVTVDAACAASDHQPLLLDFVEEP